MGVFHKTSRQVLAGVSLADICRPSRYVQIHIIHILWSSGESETKPDHNVPRAQADLGLILLRLRLQGTAGSDLHLTGCNCSWQQQDVSLSHARLFLGNISSARLETLQPANATPWHCLAPFGGKREAHLTY